MKSFSAGISTEVDEHLSIMAFVYPPESGKPDGYTMFSLRLDDEEIVQITRNEFMEFIETAKQLMETVDAKTDQNQRST